MYNNSLRFSVENELLSNGQMIKIAKGILLLLTSYGLWCGFMRTIGIPYSLGWRVLHVKGKSPALRVVRVEEDFVFCRGVLGLMMQEIKPEMIGIGPFLPHKDTPFANEKIGELELTLILISVLRLIFPLSLIPATTALGTIKEGGRELGILHGANVVMPNLSPMNVRKKYLLYNNKISTGTESAEGVELLRESIDKIGYILTGARGDFDSNAKCY